jgi:type I restriction enzyme, S subunit
MELKPGYKQTEVGVIPEEWNVGTLDQFWCVTDCKHVTASFTFSGYPVASIREVQAKYVNLSNCKYTDKHFFDLLTEGGRRPKDGDLIMSRNATVGEVAQVTKDHPQFAMGQDVCLLQRRDKELSPTYLQALLQSPIIAEQLASMQVGSTFKRANIEQIRSFKVAMPPSPEQKAIAEQLDCVDDQIYAISALITKKRNIKQAAMQELLTGKRRLPGFEGEWERIRLGDHVKYLKNGTNSRAELRKDGRVKYLHYGDIHASSRSFISPHDLPSLPVPKAAGLDRLKDGDLIFADASEDITGVSKSVEIYDSRESEIASGLHTIAARFEKSILADGFKGFLQYVPSFSEHLRRLAAGTKVYATNRAHISSAEVKLPPVSEQRAIAACLSEMDAELAALEASRDKTRGLKQGMIQELLTGRIRLQ